MNERVTKRIATLVMALALVLTMLPINVLAMETASIIKKTGSETIEGAETVAWGRTYSGSLDGNAHYYKLNISQEGRVGVKVTFDQPAKEFMYVYLTDKYKTIIGQWCCDGEWNSRCQFSGATTTPTLNIDLKPGNEYYLCIDEGQTYFKGSYSFTATYTDELTEARQQLQLSSSKTASTTQSYNTLEDADAKNAISVGNYITGRLTSFESKTGDYYKIVIPKAGEYRIDFTMAQPADWYVYLRMNDKTKTALSVLAKNEGATYKNKSYQHTGAGSDTIYATLDAGTYYLCIDEGQTYFYYCAYNIKFTLNSSSGSGGTDITPTPTPDPTPTPVATTYTVTFDSQGGSAVASQTVESGKTATKPADPTKDGYVFKGWGTSKTATSYYDYSTKVTGNLTLYAIWEQKQDGDITVVKDGDKISFGKKYRVNSKEPVALHIDASRLNCQSHLVLTSNMRLSDETEEEFLDYTLYATGEHDYSSMKWWTFEEQAEEPYLTYWYGLDYRKGKKELNAYGVPGGWCTLKVLNESLGASKETSNAWFMITATSAIEELEKTLNAEVSDYYFPSLYLEDQWETLSNNLPTGDWTGGQLCPGGHKYRFKTDKEASLSFDICTDGDVGAYVYFSGNTDFEWDEMILSSKENHKKFTIENIPSGEYWMEICQKGDSYAEYARYNYTFVCKLIERDDEEDEEVIVAPKISKIKNTKVKTLSVSWKKVSGAKKYEVQYSTTKNFKSKKTKSVKATSLTVKNLKKGKTYYVRVRSVSASGTKSKWSSVKKLKIKK